MNGRLSKIRSVHTYGVRRVDSCFCEAVYSQQFDMKIIQTFIFINQGSVEDLGNYLFFQETAILADFWN